MPSQVGFMPTHREHLKLYWQSRQMDRAEFSDGNTYEANNRILGQGLCFDKLLLPLLYYEYISASITTASLVQGRRPPQQQDPAFLT